LVRGMIDLIRSEPRTVLPIHSHIACHTLDPLREVRLTPLLSPALGDLHSGKFDLELRLSALVLLLLVLPPGFL
jgi:hypothetical protein